MRIRTMLAPDVTPAAATLLRGNWGDRASFFRFAVGHPRCDALVAVDGDEIVGTAVGTANGTSGWVGTVFVAEERRGAGLGTALTREVVDRLESRGCRTLLLVATDLGRPIYERLGFEVDDWYAIFGRPAGAQPHQDLSRSPLIRPFEPADLDEAAALDRAATGEDRRHLLASFVAPGAGWVLREPIADGGPSAAEPANAILRDAGAEPPSGRVGRLRGYLLRPPWSGGGIIAVEPELALRLIDHRAAVSGAGHHPRAGILASNEAGAAALSGHGWEEAWRAVRMIRGEPIPVDRGAIWGQFSFALG